MMKIRKPKMFNRFASCESGNVLVEFGMVAMLLMGTVVGAIEFTAVMTQNTKLSNAARAAVEHAMKDPAAVTEIADVAVKSGNLDSNTLNVAVSTFCECPGVGAVGCGDTCSGGETNNSFVTVNLTQPAESYFHGSGFLTSFSLAKSATLRMR
ncbi:MAG: pilus assembly protein [Rhodospirillaceae bacterium]|jgi:Flp pilus assembly protein TadG|nr:pilus assembly protein [Rhodospirillaceae bacterium]MBT5456551.1 pilus assembly protein [Rhodospirillaceae bacterium]